MVVNGVITGRCYLALIRKKGLTAFLALSLMFVSSGLGKANQEDPAILQVNRSMVMNFIKSLIIPGWGQWSNDHKGRAIAYFTAEVAGIYAYRTNYSAGEDKEIEFKIYGDDHWDYLTWSYSDDGETACGNLRTHEMLTYTGSDGQVLPIKDHHFYENISKYPEFVCGWDDIDEKWEEEERTYTPNKLTYIDMRTRSNDLYKNAQLAGTLIMVNHLISAFDAALGTDVTSFESTNYSGKFYINPLSAVNSIKLEVKF